MYISRHIQASVAAYIFCAFERSSASQLDSCWVLDILYPRIIADIFFTLLSLMPHSQTIFCRSTKFFASNLP